MNRRGIKETYLIVPAEATRIEKTSKREPWSPTWRHPWGNMYCIISTCLPYEQFPESVAMGYRPTNTYKRTTRRSRREFRPWRKCLSYEGLGMILEWLRLLLTCMKLNDERKQQSSSRLEPRQSFWVILKNLLGAVTSAVVAIDLWHGFLLILPTVTVALNGISKTN